jgi:hypothetical protein
MSVPVRRARSRQLILTHLIESHKRRCPIALTSYVKDPMTSDISQTLLEESQKLCLLARQCSDKQFAIKLYEVSDILLEMAHEPFDHPHLSSLVQ